MLTELDLLTSGTALLAALASGELGAEELTLAQLDRIAGAGAALNAVVTLDADAAVRAARAVDADRAAGRPLGPLAGLPVTVKDAFDAAGLQTSQGRAADARPATVDAPAVHRLRAAGCVVLGKTNVPAFLASLHTWNDLFGVTVSPWDPAFSSGGSSGGASAAVAAGLAVADLGSDLAGSLRVPAAWCGLFAHRPSNGIVSKRGHLPWPLDGLLEPMVSAVGPMTRSAADTELFFAQLAGPEGPEAVGWRLDLPRPRVRALGDLRVAVWTEDAVCRTDTETRAAIRSFADQLADAGARVTELVPPVGGPADQALFARLQAGEVARGMDDEAWTDARARAAAGDPAAALLTQDLRSALADLEAQRAATLRWQQLFAEVDVVLCPAVARAAITPEPDGTTPETVEVDGAVVPIDTLSDWSRLSSLGRLPATVVPLGPGAVSGLPIGAQLLGPYLEDRTPLRAAVLAEEAGLLRFRPPPGW